MNPVPDDLSFRLASTDERDGESVRRLAYLHGAPPPEGLVAIADVGGQPVAAVGFADGHAVADPQRSTPAILALLHIQRLALRAIVTVWGC